METWSEQEADKVLNAETGVTIDTIKATTSKKLLRTVYLLTQGISACRDQDKNAAADSIANELKEHLWLEAIKTTPQKNLEEFL